VSNKRHLTPDERDDFFRGHQDGGSDREDKVKRNAYHKVKLELGCIPDEDYWYWRGYRVGFAGQPPKIDLKH
jgi:hypothetical protein